MEIGNGAADTEWIAKAGRVFGGGDLGGCGIGSEVLEMKSRAMTRGKAIVLAVFTAWPLLYIGGTNEP